MKISKRTLLFRLGTVLLLIALAVLMLIIGRGHEIYLDNKTFEYEGNEYQAYYLVVAEAKGNEEQEAFKRDRVALSCMGQKIKIDFTIQDVKNGDKRTESAVISIPYSMDAVVINLPAYFAGLPQDVWMEEFVSMAITDSSSANEEVVLDEFGF